ncbi:MAG TPA: SPOR domain-containing protein [Stellaceae bacterium]|nr:SPOR domain-containing protein [Stellaceae bacterium]
MAYLEPLDPPQRPAIPYRRVKHRPHRSLMAVIALGVMAVSAGGLWLGYKVTSHEPGRGEVPLLRADTQPIKVKPEDPGGMEIPNRNRLVFDQKASETTERLLPPPETPLPRPAPPPPEPTATPEAPQPAVAQAAAPVAPAAAAPAPPPAAPAQQQPAAVAEQHPPQSAALPPALKGTAIGRGYRLQVGAVRTAESAAQEWARIKRQNGDLVGSLGVATERVDLGDKGVFYRIQAGPLADGAEADRICSALRQRNVGCLLVKP